MTLLEQARQSLIRIAAENNWSQNEIVEIVSARDLSAEEAIGKPDRTDYPLLTGKEVMMEARFCNGIGQAFTDQAGEFRGSLNDVLNLPLDSNFHRAIFISTLNAVLQSIGQIEGTVHCKDKEPALCAQQLPDYIEKNFGRPKIAFVGFQPALIEALNTAGFDMRVTDLNPDNIGKVRCGVQIFDASLNSAHAKWADIILTTGSVLVNDSYHELQQGKPVLYYGVTVVGLAKLFDLPRICFYGH